MLWTWGAPVLTVNGRVKGGVSSPRSCLWNVHSKKWRDLFKLQWQYKYLAFLGKWVQPSDACLIVYPDFFFVVDTVITCQHWCSSQAHVCTSTRFFFVFFFLPSLLFCQWPRLSHGVHGIMLLLLPYKKPIILSAWDLCLTSHVLMV